MSTMIKVTSNVARDFLQNAAYFSNVPKVVWEYVSNSVDNPKPGHSVNVDVKISKQGITIEDDGQGMSREGLRNFFEMHGENVQRIAGRQGVRGRYGTGKCAAFGIADKYRIETINNGLLNIVELGRKDIQQVKSGAPFPVQDKIVDKPATEEDGTRVIISRLNIKNTEVTAAIAYVERHLGRQLQSHNVIVNDHVCEYQEPVSSRERRFHPDPSIENKIGALELAIKISPVPLEKERSGIDILSRGIWHDTHHGTIDGDLGNRIFGEVDMPLLEDTYDQEKIPPFDNTRNMTLNQRNPLVVILLGWVDECLHEVADELASEEKERKASDEARRLNKHAKELADILNVDFRGLEIELERIRRQQRQHEKAGVDDLIPGLGEQQTEYNLGGAEHGDGDRGDTIGPGLEERIGPSLVPGGEELGGPGQAKERKHKQSTFSVEYKNEGSQSKRSRYVEDARSIVINLDHPQIARAARDGGSIESKQFKEMSYEVAFVEYAMALIHEKLRRDSFYYSDSQDLLWEFRDTINRVSRAV